jgi:hypothetical protein
MTCSMCDPPDPNKLDSFNARRQIVGGVREVTNKIWRDIHLAFPDLIDLATNPVRWDADMCNWLGRGAQRLEPALIYVDVVEAPLELLTASCVRLDCANCGSHSTMIVINAAFIAAIRCVWDGSLMPEVPIPLLTGLLTDMRHDPYRLRRGPHLQTSDSSWKLIVAGFAWVLCHEAAHAMRGRVIMPDALNQIPDWCKSSVLSELDADFIALRMLLHRVYATPQYGTPSARIRNISVGIELILRGLSLVESLQLGHCTEFESYGSVYDDGSPTPKLRLEFALQTLTSLCDLYSIALFDPTDQSMFRGWSQTLRRLFERNDQCPSN